MKCSEYKMVWVDEDAIHDGIDHPCEECRQEIIEEMTAALEQRAAERYPNATISTLAGADVSEEITRRNIRGPVREIPDGWYQEWFDGLAPDHVLHGGGKCKCPHEKLVKEIDEGRDDRRYRIYMRAGRYTVSGGPEGSDWESYDTIDEAEKAIDRWDSVDRLQYEWDIGDHDDDDDEIAEADAEFQERWRLRDATAQMMGDGAAYRAGWLAGDVPGYVVADWCEEHDIHLDGLLVARLRGRRYMDDSEIAAIEHLVREFDCERKVRYLAPLSDCEVIRASQEWQSLIVQPVRWIGREWVDCEDDEEAEAVLILEGSMDDGTRHVRTNAIRGVHDAEHRLAGIENYDEEMANGRVEI